MAGPWEAFQNSQPAPAEDSTTSATDQPQAGPWSQYAAPATAPATDQQADTPGPWSAYAPAKDQQPGPWSAYAPAQDQPSSSGPGRFIRAAAEAAPAAIGSLPAIGEGIAAGAEIGAAGGPIGAGIGGAVGGLAAAAGAGYLITKAKDWVMDQLGLRQGTGVFSNAQRQADAQHDDLWSTAGDLAPNLLGFGTGIAKGGVSLAQRGIGGAIFGGQEAAQEYANKGELDPAKIGLSFAAGAAMPAPRDWAQKVMDRGLSGTAGARLGATMAKVNPVPGRPNVTAPPETAEEHAVVDNAQDVHTVAPGTAADNSPVKEVPGVGNGEQGPGVRDQSSRDQGKDMGAQAQVNMDAPNGMRSDILAALKGQLVQKATKAEAQPPVQTGIEQAAPPAPPAPPVEATRNIMNGETPEETEARLNAIVRKGATPASDLEAKIRDLARQGKTASEIGQIVGMNHNEVRAIRDGTPAEPAAPVQTGIAENAPATTDEAALPANAKPTAYEAAPGDKYAHPDPDFKDTTIDHTKQTPGTLAQITPDGRTVLIDKGVPPTIDVGGKPLNPAVPLSLREIVARQAMDHVNETAKGQDPARVRDVAQRAGANAANEWLSKNGYDLIDANKALDKLARANKAVPTAADKHTPVVVPEVLEKLRARGDEAIAKQIEQAPPGEREQLIMRAQSSLEGMTPKPGNKVVRKRAPLLRLSNGMGAANETIRARRQGAIDAQEKVWNDERFKKLPVEPGDTSTEGKAKLKQWAQDVNKAAIEAGGGTHPNDIYGAKDRSKEYLFLKIARALNTKGGMSTVRPPDDLSPLEKFYAQHDLLRNGGEEGRVAVRDDIKFKAARELAKIKTSEEADAEKPAMALDTSRHEFEPLPEWKPGADLSKPEIDASNALRKWINDLSPEDYARLTEIHEDIAHDVEATQDPEWVLDKYQSDLENYKPRGTPVKTAADLEKPVELKRVAEKPIPASENIKTEGKSLKGTPEFERLKALYEGGGGQKKIEAIPGGAQAPKAKELPEPNMTAEDIANINVPKRVKKGMLAAFGGDETAAVGGRKNARRVAGEAKPGANAPEKDIAQLKDGTKNTPAVDGTWEKFTDKVDKMLHDESGSISPLSWLKRSPKDPASPDADAGTKEYVSSLGSRMMEFTKGSQNVRSLVRAAVQMSPSYASKEEALVHHNQAYRWLEDHPDSADDVRIKDNKVFDIVRLSRSMLREYRSTLDEIRAVDPTNEFDLPPVEALDAKTEKGHVPALRVMDKTVAGDEDPFKPGNRSLSSWRGALQQRDFKTLTNGEGVRLVVSPDKKNNWRVWEDGTPTNIALPEDFEGHVGQSLTVNVNGKDVKLTVDNATRREVMKNVKDDNKQPLAFHEAPLLTIGNALIQARDALASFKLVNEVKNSKEFQDHSIVVHDEDTLQEAKDKGYIQTKLDQLKRKGQNDIYMDRRLAEAFDDFRQPGVDEDSFNALRTASTNLIKSLFVMNPLVHGINVAASWGTQRGFDWVTPKGNKNLVVSLTKAIKAVATQDMSVMRPALDHGLTLLLPGTLNQRIMQNSARRAGIELIHNPDWFDKIMGPVWGVKAKDVGHAMMQYANRITWGMSDVMTLQRYLENVDLKGMSPADAVKETHEFLPDYRVPTRVGEKWLGPVLSRAAAKVLKEPALSLFGAFHYDLFKQLAGMTKGAVSGDPKAAGQLMAMAVGMYFVYPYLLDRGAQEVTGNKDATFARRGPYAPAQAISDATGLTTAVNSMVSMLTGNKTPKNLNPPSLATDVFMPTIPIKVASEALSNKDFANHPIFQAPRNKGDIKQWGKAAAHVLDWAFGDLSPPYQILSSEAKKNTRGDLGARILEEQLGIKNPSPAAVKYANQAPKRVMQEEKYRNKHQGFLEKIIGR